MDIEAELLKSLSRDALEKEVADRISSFHGLLTREVALRLIAKEMGLLKDEEREYALADIPKGARKIMFSATVRKIWPVAAYSSGKRSRVVEVTDAGLRERGAPEHGAPGQGTAEMKSATVMPLVLWNDDVELANGLRTRDRISVRGAYEKGGELHLGYSGALETSHKAAFSDLGSLEEGREVHVRGFITAMEGHGSFVRGGRTVKGFAFTLSDGTNERRCVMLEGLGRTGNLKVGDEVLVEDGLVSRGNIEVSAGRLLSRRKSEMLIGRIMKLDCKDDALAVDVEGQEITLDRENALRFMGVEVAGDIALSTVTALKKDILLNSRIVVRIVSKDGHIRIA